MKRLRLSPRLVAIIAGALCLVTANVGFVQATSVSYQPTPSGANDSSPWSYGYSRAFDGSFVLFDKQVVGSLEGWSNSQSSQAAQGAFVNASSAGVNVGASCTYEPGDVVVHPGRSFDGEFTHIRFTSPSDSSYGIAVTWTAIDQKAQRTEVWVNFFSGSSVATPLFHDSLSGSQGARAKNYNLPGIDLKKGDVLDFVVGSGGDSEAFDSLKIELAIATVPPSGQTTLRVLFAYTSEAASQVGGVSQIKERVDNGVRLLNEALANSETGVSVEAITQMVEVEGVPVPVDQAAYSALLSDMANVNGHFTGVHQARHDYKADVVALVTTGFLMGQGNLGHAPPIDNKSTALMALHFDSFGSTYVFPHEFGHVLGCGHQLGVEGSDGIYSYSHGYNPGQGWRTVTANSGISIPYFSADREVVTTLPGASSASTVRIGNSSTADCSRSIKEVAPTYATFGEDLPRPTPGSGEYATMVIQDPASVPVTPVTGPSFSVSNAICASRNVTFTYTATDSVTVGYQYRSPQGDPSGSASTTLNPGSEIEKCVGPPPRSCINFLKGETVEIWQLPPGAPDDPSEWPTTPGANKVIVSQPCS